MKIFVSSTVYDLLDVRAELIELLRSLKVAPVMSDEKLSDFNSTHDANSIETCLLNVQSSDAVILVLNQRYGPRLGKCGFDDVSATHLEYRQAKKHGIPLCFFVRDRLEADYIIQKNNSESVKTAWIDERNLGLFDLMEEHRSLSKGREDSNWLTTFSTTVDLKLAIEKQLEDAVKPRVLTEAVEKNQFPTFEREVQVDPIFVAGEQKYKLAISFRNISTVMAFDFKLVWSHPEVDQRVLQQELVAPGQEFENSFVTPRTSVKLGLNVEFNSAIGVRVHEVYEVGYHIVGGAVLSGANRISQEFRHAPKPILAIQR